jgi:hypothetical protein
MGPGDVIALALVCLAMVKILGPVGEAIASRLRPARATEPDMELMAEVDTLKTRLAEVEERLDFAERLLARADLADQLPGRVEP